MAVPVLAVRDGNNAAQNVSAVTDNAGNIQYNMSLDSGRAYYRASATRTAVITTTAKTIINIQGSATKTVRVTKIAVCITAGTAAECVLALQRTNTQGAGGTAVAPTIAKLDTASGTPTATALVQHFTTGAQAQGVAVGGPIAFAEFSQQVTTTGPTFLGGAGLVWLFPECGVMSGQAIVLRGTADFLEVQTASAIGTTPACSYVVEWVEDGS